MNIITDKARIEEMLLRGTVAEVLPTREELVAKLTSGARLRIYIGFDPTFTALHLGHAKNLIFLEELRALGHEVIVLFGDFTARIGDPDKSATRTALTAEQVAHNVAGWLKQVAPIISFNDAKNPARIVYNSEWLSTLTFADVIQLASNFTVQQMIERDLFERRIKAGTPIHLHEFFYPIMQGYDSVALDVDMELCGTDQIFNALAGRTLLKRMKNKDKMVVALNLLANPATGQLMSKSNGTGVFIDQAPAQLFGSLMALPDPMLEPLFMNCTRIPLAEKDGIMALGPRAAKARIASDIVARFHGVDAAKAAEAEFEATFAKGGVPEDVSEIAFSLGESLVEALIKAAIVPSKAEWRRLVLDGAVKILAKDASGTTNEEKVSDPAFSPRESVMLKVGKRRFINIVIR